MKNAVLMEEYEKSIEEESISLWALKLWNQGLKASMTDMQSKE